MPDTKKSRPTRLGPIFVGPGIGADYAAELSLLCLELILSKEKMELPGTVEGDISSWIKQLFEKPGQMQQRAIREHDPAAVLREVSRVAALGAADSGNKSEMDLAAVLGDVSLEDMKNLATALQAGDITIVNKIRSEMSERLDKKLGKPVASDVLRPLFALAARSRAARAAALCMAFYKMHPLSLIAAAQNGHREAVLKLVKVDKLFLTDGCTATEIRRAELQEDCSFLRQLARAITYVPKIGWRHGCRVYLYALLSSGIPLPGRAKLQLRFDPEGNRFKGMTSFEKFVERSRKEFERMAAHPVDKD